MSRQHQHPFLVREGAAPHALEADPAHLDEAWLQAFVFDHPQTVPIDEIEPAFGPLVPLCREMPTPAGPVDIAFINRSGLVTLVECKLWRNPEARRHVVGQILDYAKEVCLWDHQDLEEAVRTARRNAELSLWDVVGGEASDMEEADFSDAVSRNLRRGRFLLLLLGDGIHENTCRLAEYMESHAHLNFALGLVEIAIYRLPDEIGGSHLVVPRLVARTVEIEKAVVRIEGGRVEIGRPATSPATPSTAGRRLSEQIFVETVAADDATRAAFARFLDSAKGLGLYTEPGRNSLKLKSSMLGANFANFTTSGHFWNSGMVSSTAEAGCRDIGEDYLAELAGLLSDGFVQRSANLFYWTVKVRPDRMPTLAEGMARAEPWLDLIRRTVTRMSEIEIE